ncbi:hypothetical protein BB560_006693 [Smittium megazygosporum]|uniref:SH3 domain-containing protein n=1 Tax=Smittium megazygosporum TaxID=133381 RepID=A0A2T9Y2E0_9FUNG|nr:hypothetical protein BB560_006693 [Smittium megazygosporum]
MSNENAFLDEEIDYSRVYALYDFVAMVQGQITVQRGEKLNLLDDSNSYWWLVQQESTNTKISCLPKPTPAISLLQKKKQIPTLYPPSPKDPYYDSDQYVENSSGDVNYNNDYDYNSESSELSDDLDHRAPVYHHDLYENPLSNPHFNDNSSSDPYTNNTTPSSSHPHSTIHDDQIQNQYNQYNIYQPSDDLSEPYPDHRQQPRTSQPNQRSLYLQENQTEINYIHSNSPDISNSDSTVPPPSNNEQKYIQNDSSISHPSQTETSNNHQQQHSINSHSHSYSHSEINEKPFVVPVSFSYDENSEKITQSIITVNPNDTFADIVKESLSYMGIRKVNPDSCSVEVFVSRLEQSMYVDPDVLFFPFILSVLHKIGNCDQILLSRIIPVDTVMLFISLSQSSNHNHLINLKVPNQNHPLIIQMYNPIFQNNLFLLNLDGYTIDHVDPSNNQNSYFTRKQSSLTTNANKTTGNQSRDFQSSQKNIENSDILESNQRTSSTSQPQPQPQSPSINDNSPFSSRSNSLKFSEFPFEAPVIHSSNKMDNIITDVSLDSRSLVSNFDENIETSHIDFSFDNQSQISSEHTESLTSTSSCKEKNASISSYSISISSDKQENNSPDLKISEPVAESISSAEAQFYDTFSPDEIQQAEQFKFFNRNILNSKNSDANEIKKINTTASASSKPTSLKSNRKSNSYITKNLQGIINSSSDDDISISSDPNVDDFLSKNGSRTRSSSGLFGVFNRSMSPIDYNSIPKFDIQPRLSPKNSLFSFNETSELDKKSSKTTTTASVNDSRHIDSNKSHETENLNSKSSISSQTEEPNTFNNNISIKKSEDVVQSPVNDQTISKHVAQPSVSSQTSSKDTSPKHVLTANTKPSSHQGLRKPSNLSSYSFTPSFRSSSVDIRESDSVITSQRSRNLSSDKRIPLINLHHTDKAIARINSERGGRSTSFDGRRSSSVLSTPSSKPNTNGMVPKSKRSTSDENTLKFRSHSMVSESYDRLIKSEDPHGAVYSELPLDDWLVMMRGWLDYSSMEDSVGDNLNVDSKYRKLNDLPFIKENPYLQIQKEFSRSLKKMDSVISRNQEDKIINELETGSNDGGLDYGLGINFRQESGSSTVVSNNNSLEKLDSVQNNNNELFGDNDENGIKKDRNNIFVENMKVQEIYKDSINVYKKLDFLQSDLANLAKILLNI